MVSSFWECTVMAIRGCGRNHFPFVIMIKTFIHNKWRSVPDKWNDLTVKQLVQVLSVFGNTDDVVQAKLKLLKIITGLNWWQWVNASADELNDRLHLVDFLIKENTLTRNLLPSYRGFAGPADDFENLVMSEFVYTEAFFQQKADNYADVEALDNLISILYRKKKKGYDSDRNQDGDIREPFNEFVCKHYAKDEVCFWPLKVKECIFFWYEGCRSKLAADFPEVFAGGEGDPAKYGLVSIMRNVAEKGVHGKFEDVERKPVRLIMLELDEMMTEAKNLKDSMNHG